jgi:hypothetical protein
MKRIFFFLFFLVLLCGSVSAIGMSPPLYRIDFQEETQLNLSFAILNRDGAATNIRVFADGSELSEYVTFSETEFEFDGTAPYGITATLDMPSYSEVSSFGKQRININAEEFVTTGGTFAAVTAVEGAIFVQVPQPGLYAEITDFSVDHTVAGYDTQAEVELTNRGTDTISSGELSLQIFESENTILNTFLVQDIDLNPAESKSFTIDIPSDSYVSAKYEAVVSFDYTSTRDPATDTKSFFVGSTDIELVNYTSSLISGSINRVNITLQSLWGSPLTNVRGLLVVGDSQQSLPVIDFNPFEEQVVSAFIDIPLTNATQEEGVLSLTASAENGDFSRDYDLSFDLTLPKEEFNVNITLIILVVAVVLIIGVLVILLLRKQKA